MRLVGAVDMGSSGARVARIEVDRSEARIVSELVPIAKTLGRRGFRRVLRDAVAGVDAVGVAIAGPTDPSTGEVRFAGAYPWARGDLAGRWSARLGVPVGVLNDAEAHLVAHRDLGRHPMVCLAVGTGLGFAMTDDTGALRRPRADTNWELGHLPVTGSVYHASTDPEDRAVLALSGRGLHTLRQTHGEAAGTERFTARMANFVHATALVFQPRTVVLAGGVAAALGPDLVAAARTVLSGHWPASLRWDPPVVLDSPFGGNSALLGAAHTAADRVRD